LAILLGFVEDAFQIAKDNNNSLKLKQVGDLALAQGLLKTAISSYECAGDLAGLLLIYSSLGLKSELEALGLRALKETKMNIAF
jgi:coatomer subunit beta'